MQNGRSSRVTINDFSVIDDDKIYEAFIPTELGIVADNTSNVIMMGRPSWNEQRQKYTFSTIILIGELVDKSKIKDVNEEQLEAE